MITNTWILAPRFVLTVLGAGQLSVGVRRALHKVCEGKGVESRIWDVSYYRRNKGTRVVVKISEGSEAWAAQGPELILW